MSKVLFSTLVLSMFLFSSILFANEGKDDYVLGKEAKPGTVKFSHKKHHKDLKISCEECHHTWKKEKEPSPKKCYDCHLKKADEKNKLKRKKAFHKNCTGCHKKKKQGPKKCKGCHEKKKK